MMSIKITIVDDSAEAANRMEALLTQYADPKNLDIVVKKYSDGFSFIENYNKNTDIVFMDIRMPSMDGVQAAHELRKIDSRVVLIFITNHIQYAVKGYEVEAQNFLVKPLKYGDLCFTMDKALSRLKMYDFSDYKISLTTDRGTVVLRASEIVYIEIVRHRLYFHMPGAVYDMYGTLNDIEEQIAPYGFMRCNACYLVNLRYVRSVKRYSCVLWDGEKQTELSVSRNKYKSFMDGIFAANVILIASYDKGQGDSGSCHATCA